jgi:hypothetical protein
MGIKIKDAGGVLQTAASLKVMDGATLRTIRTVKVMDATATLRLVASLAPAMTASITPPYETAYGYSPGVATVTSGSVVAAPTGGLAPYTYAWTRLSGVGTINSPALATSSFSASVAESETDSGEFQVTVTDSAGQTATATANVDFTNTYTGGGFL